MTTLRVIDATYLNENSIEFSLFICYGSTELFITDEVMILPENQQLLTLKSLKKGSVALESLPFDFQLFSTNSKLTIPLYQSGDSTQILAKIQLASIASPPSPSKLPDLSDLSSFSSISKASTLTSDDLLSTKLHFQHLAECINEELKNSVIKHQRIREIDKSAKESILQDLKNTKNEYNTEREHWKTREKLLISELEQSENNLTGIKYELLKLKTENKALAAENSRMASVSKESLFVMDDARSNSNNLSFTLNELDNLRKNSSGSTNDSSEIVKQKDQIIKKLTSELNEAKVLNKSILLSRQVMKGNELDEILMQKLRVFKIPGTFVRDPEQSYLFNGKKVTVMIKGGQLMCRVGTAFRPFDEFAKSMGLSSRSISHKRIKSMGSYNDTKPQSPKSQSRSKLN